MSKVQHKILNRVRRVHKPMLVPALQHDQHHMAGSRITLELGTALLRLCTYCNTEVKVNDFLG